MNWSMFKVLNAKVWLIHVFSAGEVIKEGPLLQSAISDMGPIGVKYLQKN